MKRKLLNPFLLLCLLLSYEVVVAQQLHVFNLSGTQNIPFPVTIPGSGMPVAISHNSAGQPISVITDDRRLHVYNLSGTQNNPFPVTIPGSGIPVDLSQNDLGQRIAVVTDDRRLHLFNLSGTQGVPFPVSIPGSGKPVAVSHNSVGMQIAIATDDRRLHLFNTSGTQNIPFPVSIPGSGIPIDLIHSESGQQIAIVTNDRRLHVFNLSGTQNNPFPVTIPGSGIPTAVSFNNTGIQITVTTDDRMLHVYNMSGTQNNPFPVSIPGAGIPVDLGHSDANQHIAVITSDQMLHLFNLSGTENNPFPVSIPGGGLPVAVANNSSGQQISLVTAAPCTFSIAPQSQSFEAGGGTGVVNVTTQAGCTWTAVSNDPWITITTGSNGSGIGQVGYRVAPHSGSNSRTGTLTIAGRTFTITQSGCTFAINPGSQSFGSVGGAGIVDVSTAPGCTWMAVSNALWLSITSGSSGSGNGRVNYTVEMNNSTLARTGTMTIAGQTFTVNQAESSPMNRPPLVSNPIPDQNLEVNGPAFSRDLNQVFFDPDGDPLSFSANSSNSSFASVSVMGSVLRVSPGIEGNAIITVTAQDILGQSVQTTFMVTVSPDMAVCWEVDAFDNLSLGSLNGKNGWFTVPGRSDAFVVQAPVRPGNALLLDAGFNQTVIMGKRVNVQRSGVHVLELDVRVSGNPSLLSLAKIEVRTNGNPGWDKKFQLYFGAHMRLNFGPTQNDALEFLSPTELQNNRWYKVRAVINLNTNLVDIFLDNEPTPRLQGIPVGAGPITDIGISAWDRPGTVFFDNLNFCSGSAIGPESCGSLSFFDSDDEGWRTICDSQEIVVTPDHLATDGNPGGYISATDDAREGVWYWQAPAAFLGDVSCAFGQALTFDLRQSTLNNLFDYEDIILEGGGLRLLFDTPDHPDTSWTSYSIPLVETAGWRKDSLSGNIPTQEEMLSVLTSLQKLWIRGEYSDDPDTGDLDNVVLSGISAGVGPAVHISENLDDSSGDGDGRAEPGEAILLTVTIQNLGVQVARDVTAIITSSDPDISISDNSNSWQDIPAGGSRLSDESFGFEVNVNLTGQKVVTLTMTVTASNGGPWMSSFDIAIGTQTNGTLLIVTNTDDAGPGSLRNVIEAANTIQNFNAATPDLIQFDIPGFGPHFIQPLSALPNITESVIIDGTSQPGFPGTPIIVLDGINTSEVDGLTITAGSSVIRGLAVGRFISGIKIGSNGGNKIEANYIGVGVDGLLPRPNSFAGVWIENTANNTIGGTNDGLGNLISSSSGDVMHNVLISGINATGNLVHGNSVFFSENGVSIENAPDNNIGGTGAGTSNIIGGNTNGIRIFGVNATGNLVQGNFIGVTDEAETSPIDNENGVVLDNAPDNIIGGTTPAARNLISTNNNIGVWITGAEATGNLVQGNFIGPDITGTIEFGSNFEAEQFIGVHIENSASNNTIGGTSSGTGNLISANRRGVLISGIGVTGNRVEGNLIGTDVSGVNPLGNSTGVIVNSGASGNIIGGTTTSARNLISANGGFGFGNNVEIEDPNTTGNLVQGNFIGTDLSGTIALGGGFSGIHILNAANNSVGGTEDGAGNLISGNPRGIVLEGNNAIGNLIQGNRIGTDVNGTENLGNVTVGVVIEAAVANTIGGSMPGAANLIAYNGGDGVQVVSGNGNRVLSNAIFNNALLGINLGENGITPNDTTDVDTGANQLQNFPVFTSALIDMDTINIMGTFNSQPLMSYRIEFFASSLCNGDANGEGTTVDSLSFGEGEVFLGADTVSTDNLGNAIISVRLPGIVEDGSFVTGTATDLNGNTSEFSKCIEVDSLITSIDEADIDRPDLPAAFELKQNYPNPFTDQTFISFQIPKSEQVTIEILTLLGQKVYTLVNEKKDTGYHMIKWNGQGFNGKYVSSGVFIYRIKAGEFADAKKLVLIR